MQRHTALYYLRNDVVKLTEIIRKLKEADCERYAKQIGGWKEITK